MADVAWLKEQRTRLWDLFDQFHSVRRDNWRRLVAREMPLTLPPDLQPYWADMQDPLLEDDMSQRIGILMLDQTKIDCVAMGEGEHYERDVEKVRLHAAVSQLKQNQGRWRDQYIAEGQVLDGVAIIRKLWDLPEEPADESEREEYYKDLDHWPWTERGIDALQCAWDGENMEEPEIFMQEAEKRYYAAKADWRPNGKEWRLSTAGKIVLLGPDVTVDEAQNANDKKIKFLICDYRDPESGKRYICEYIYPEDSFADGEVVFEDEVPFGRCSYFVIPSGELRRHETNPHKRYRPMMYALMTSVYTYNFVIGNLAAISQRAISDRNVYLDPSRVAPETMQALEGVGVTVEGSGALRNLTFHPPELPAGDIPILPGALVPWPNNITDALQIILAETKEAIASFRANRFLTGDVSENVVSNATATTFSANTQAAALPFGRALVMSDEYQRQDIVAEHQCIIYWDEGKEAGAQKPYYATAPQEMNFLKGQAQAGETARITAEMLRTRKFLVNVQTQNVTEQERAMQNQMAFLEYNQGTLTDLQLYRRLGHDDPRSQQKEMAKFESRKMLGMKYAPFWASNLDAFFAATAGLNPAAMAGAQQMAPQPPQGAPGAPQPPGGGTAGVGPIPPPQGVTGGSNPMAGVGGLGGG